MIRVRDVPPVSLGLVLLAAAGLAVLLCRSLVTPVSRLYPLDLQAGEWLESAARTPNAYFRKELAVEGPVRDAWLAFAAPDCAYEVFVNGTSVVSLRIAERTSAGIVVDIGPFLKNGKNVVAVQVESGNYTGAARAVVEGAWRDRRGQVHPFASDASWVALAQEEAQAAGRVHWSSPDFLGGAPAVSWGRPAPAELPLVPVLPDLYRLPAPAEWIGHRDAAASSVVFSSRFDMPNRRGVAWLRIIAQETYSIAINGQPIAQRESSGKEIDLVDVSPYVRRGTNAIDVRVAASHSGPRVALDLVSTLRGEARVVLHSDERWRSRLETTFRAQRAPETGSEVMVWGELGTSAGAIRRAVVATTTPAVFLAGQLGLVLLLVLGSLAAALADWLAAGLLLSRAAPGTSLPEALRRDALLRLPVLLGLGVLFLSAYDVRVEERQVYQLAWAAGLVALLFALRAGLLLSGLRLAAARAPSEGPRLRRAAVLACALALAGTGFAVRLQHASARSLDHDEVSIGLAAEEVIGRGYPMRSVGPLDKLLTTYELLPYPIALSIAAFGRSETAVRLPALLFACATTLLLFRAASRYWGDGAGLLAAAIHAFSPFGIYWGSNAFHPQQAQFFALLCAWAFERAVDVAARTPLRRRPLAVATAAMVATYLTWEGAGLLLPALFLALLARRGRDLSWVRDRALWAAVGVMVVVVAVQQAIRILANVPYLVVGLGLSARSFALAFLDPLYDPQFYLNAFLLPEHHLVLSLTVLAGLPLLLRDAAGRYYLTVMGTLLLLLQNLLAIVSSRYAFFVQPFLILCACAVMATAARAIRSALSGGDPALVRFTTTVSMAAAALVVFLATNTLVFRLHRLGSLPERITQMTPEYQGIDYRSAARVVREQRRPDDVVIALMPHAFKFYADLPSDYYLQTYTNRQVFYDVSQQLPGHMDRFVGTPVLRNKDELMDVLGRHRRVWILATPYNAFELSNDDPTLTYVHDHARVVFESYGVRVYLWEH